MKTMNEIKKMTAEELADFLTENYEGCEDGLFFIMDIDGYEVRYTVGLDNEGIVDSLIRQGKLSEKDIDEIIKEKCEDYYKEQIKEENYYIKLADGYENIMAGLIFTNEVNRWQFEEFRKEAISELAEIYSRCEEEVDREVIEYFRDEIIDEIEEELQELKYKDEDEEW